MHLRIVQQLDKNTCKLATAYSAEGNYLKTIELLEPHYQSDAKSHNLILVRLLADAYMHCAREFPNYRERAFPLWKILRDDENKQLIPNYPGIVKILISLMICVDNKPELREMMTQEALKIMKDNAGAFLIADKRNKLNDSYLKSMRYTVCISAGISNAFTGDTQTDAGLKNKYFQRARNYFIAALEHMPGDLSALLHYAKFIIVESRQNIQVAIDLLVPFENRYRQSPSYNFAMKKLYLLIEQGSRAAVYEKRYADCTQSDANEDIDGLLSVFKDPKLPETPENCSAAERLYLARMKSNQNNFDEAKKILYSLINDFPNYTTALETLATIESSILGGDDVTTVDRILKINPQSLTALIIKADIICRTAMTDDQLREAHLLYEKAFDAGSRDLNILNKLICFSIVSRNYQKIIRYSMERLKRDPSQNSRTYFFIGHSHYKLNQYQESLDAFKQIRVFDKYWERNLISFYVLCCIFNLAQTRDEYKACAKKLSSHLARIKDDEYNPVLDIMLKHFQELDIPVHLPPHFVKPLEEESKSVENNYCVPEYVKEKINEWLEKNGAQGDQPIREKIDEPVNDALDESQENLYHMGDPDLHIYAYIPKNNNIPNELLPKFEKALASHNLLSLKAKSQKKGHKNGLEQLHNGRFAVVIRGDYRLLSTGIFFKKRTDDPTKHKTIIRVDKLKTHAQLDR